MKDVPLLTVFVKHQLSLAEIRQSGAHADRRFAIVASSHGTRICPGCSTVVAGQDEGTVGIVTPDQHQQPILLRHVDNVGNRDHPVPALGDNLEPRRKTSLPGLAIELSNFMRLPLGQPHRWRQQYSQGNHRRKVFHVLH